MSDIAAGQETRLEPALDQSPELTPPELSRWERFANWTSERKYGLGIGIAASAVAVGAVAAEHVAGPQDWKALDIASVGEFIISHGGGAAGTVLLGLGATETAYRWATKGGSPANKANFELGDRGVAQPGIQKDKSELRKSWDKIRRGVALPALGILALSSAFMINQGINEGPQQSISAMADGAAKAAGTTTDNIFWAFQPGTNHFMDRSDISPETIAEIQRYATSSVPSDMQALAFKADLTTVPTQHSSSQAGLVMRTENIDGEHPSPLTPKVKEGALCKVVDERCVLDAGELIVDAKEGLSIGQSVEIQGSPYKVVAFSQESQSLLDRLVVYTGMSEADRQKDYFGLAIEANSKADIEKMIKDLHLEQQLSAETTDELLEYTKDFWEHNGTPLVALLVLDTMLLGTASLAAYKQSKYEENRNHYGLLRSLGMGKRELRRQMRIDSTLTTAKAIVPAYAGAAAIEIFLNSSLPGFHTELNPLMVGGAAGLLLASQVAAGMWEVRKFCKEAPKDQMSQA